jgi:uncharacterized YccA/Bax inhibitor family protein
MGEHASWITQLVNHYLGGAALALLSALHIRPNNPELPIPEHVVMGLLVLAVGTVLGAFAAVRRKAGSFAANCGVFAEKPAGIWHQ